MNTAMVPSHAQLSSLYLLSTLDVTHVIKCTRLSPQFFDSCVFKGHTQCALGGRAWERGYSLGVLLDLQVVAVSGQNNDNDVVIDNDIIPYIWRTLT